MINNTASAFSFKRIWRSAAIVGVIMAIFTTPFIDTYPWLIFVSIGLGAAVLLRDGDKGIRKSLSVGRISINQLLIKINFKIAKTKSIPALTDPEFIEKPEVRIESQQALIEHFISATEKPRRIALIGLTGAGKTTVASGFFRRCKDDPTLVLKKQPMLLQFSKAPARRNGVASLVTDMVASQVSIVPGPVKRTVAKDLIKKGSLCLILDDLDFLDKKDLIDLGDLILERKQTSFLCLASSSGEADFLKSFEPINIPFWTPDEVVAYIESKVPNLEVRKELLSFLERKSDEIKKGRTPFEWSCIVNAALQGRLFEMLRPNLPTPTDYQILDDYLQIVLGRGSEANLYLNEIGKLSLRLLKKNRRDFILNELDTRDLRVPLATFAPKLFEKRGEAFSMHGTQQVFMASKYLANSWQEAKVEIADGSARPLIWTPVYFCTRQMISPDYIPELDHVFQSLGRSTSAKAATHL